jgi:hypothetical protein
MIGGFIALGADRPGVRSRQKVFLVWIMTSVAGNPAVGIQRRLAGFAPRSRHILQQRWKKHIHSVFYFIGGHVRPHPGRRGHTHVFVFGRVMRGHGMAVFAHTVRFAMKSAGSLVSRIGLNVRDSDMTPFANVLPDSACVNLVMGIEGLVVITFVTAKTEGGAVGLVAPPQKE